VADRLLSPDALLALPEATSLDEILDVVLAGWDDDYAPGRQLLLTRLRTLRQGHDPAALRPTAGIIYRALITFGEEAGDMRFVHLAVESRDALLHGL
jgi:hypothetical protein